MLKWILFSGILLVLALGIALVTLPSATPSEVQPSASNSAIYALLVNGGIPDALVDATLDRTFISYSLPSALDKEGTWYYVMGVAAGAYPETKKVTVQAYVNEEPTEEVTAEMADVLDFVNNRVTEAQFKAKLQIV